MKTTILNRLKEPSTWAGIGGLVMAFTGLGAEHWGALQAALVSIFAAVAVFMPEQKA